MTPKFAMQDTRKADGCYVTFELVRTLDDDSTPHDYLFQDEDYREQDQARLDAWERDDWYFIGIRARAHIFIVANGVGTHMTLESPGLWSIESDSGEEYLKSVFDDEVSALKDLIAKMASPTFDA